MLHLHLKRSVLSKCKTAVQNLDIRRSLRFFLLTIFFFIICFSPMPLLASLSNKNTTLKKLNNELWYFGASSLEVQSGMNDPVIRGELEKSLGKEVMNTVIKELSYSGNIAHKKELPPEINFYLD